MRRCAEKIAISSLMNICALLCFLLPASSTARVIAVPDDVVTLQSALSSAEAHDTVRVNGGVHAPVLVTGKDSVTLLGSGWPRITRRAVTEDIAALQLRKCTGWIIRGFETDSTFAGIAIDSCAGVIIENNHCSRHSERASFHGTGIRVTNSSDVIIRRNVVVRNEFVGILAIGNRIAILNNTIGKSEGYEGIFVSDSATTGVDIINNILFSNGDNSLEYGYGAPQDGLVRYNIFWDAADGGHCVHCTLDSSNILADPLFVDIEGDDYHLSFGSPAIDRGDSSFVDPDSSRSDIGAFWFDPAGTLARHPARRSEKRLATRVTDGGLFLQLPGHGMGRHVAVSIFSPGGRHITTVPTKASANALFIPRGRLPVLSGGAYIIKVSGEKGQAAAATFMMP